MNGEIQQRLQNNGLRKTKARQRVLEVFLEKNHALSHADIESSLNSSFDRVTIYRTLSTFEDSGVIHKIPDDSEMARYALCAETCSEHHHHDNHVHFKCTSCNTSECINDLPVPEINLPAGYKISGSSLLIEGVCGKCS